MKYASVPHKPAVVRLEGFSECLMAKCDTVPHEGYEKEGICHEENMTKGDLQVSW